MKKIILLIVGGVFMASCSSESISEDVYKKDNLIQVNSKIVRFSRGLGDTQLVKDQQVGFYVLGNKGNTLYKNQTLTARADQTFTYSSNMYYPTDGTSVDFLAIHPKGRDSGVSGGLKWYLDDRFNVELNQSTDTGYLNSDLMFATVRGQSLSNTAVSLNFEHKLSKIEINIENSTGDLLNLTDFKVFGSTTTNYRINYLGEFTSTSLSDFNEILPHGAKGTQSSYIDGISAILVPQNIEEGYKFIEFSLDGVTYSHSMTKSTTLESGKKYIYNISLNKQEVDGITVRAEVADWEIGGNENIEIDK